MKFGKTILVESYKGTQPCMIVQYRCVPLLYIFFIPGLLLMSLRLCKVENK
jgi:hypothetical protein